MDGFEVRPYDDEEVARLAAALSYTSETDSGVIVDRPHVELWFQKVDLEPRSKTPLSTGTLHPPSGSPRSIG